MRIWVIGGTAAEVRFAERSAFAHQNIVAHGEALTFWGRIDHESLREFYSRSTVVVLPSFREQFGMVAVEAMMCGSAVVAARVGGLQDVVVSGHTGMLFESGNSAALAGCLLAYVNVPELSAWHGANGRLWSTRRFSSTRVLPMIEELLRSPDVPMSAIDAQPSDETFIDLAIDDLSKKVEQILDDKAVRRENLTSSQSLSFRLALERTGTVFVKQYSRRPPSLHTIHGEAAKPQLHDPALFRLNAMSRLAELPYVPAMLARDDEAGLIVQQWVEPAASPMPFEEVRRILANLGNEIASTELLEPGVVDVFEGKCRQLAASASCMTNDIQERFDLLGAELHASLHGGMLACRRMHPQVELHRIARFLDRNRVWFPQNYCTRALSEARRLLALRPFLPTPPVFAHGSLKAEHILGAPERYFLCDFDQTGYWIGPVDAVHWLWEYFDRKPETARACSFLDVLKEIVSGDEERYLAACWLLTLVVNKDLVFAMRGEWERLENSMRSLWNFSDVARALTSFS